ncbi:MAG: PKD domain-containing protein, partial [Thermofilaceae archaeon]
MGGKGVNWRGGLVLALLACVLGMRLLGINALAGWPRCISGCTAKDASITRVWLVANPACTPGAPTSAELWAEFDVERMNGICCVVSVVDVYIEGQDPLLDYITFIGDLPAKGTYERKIAEVTWTCGATVILRNVYAQWIPGTGQGCPGSCPSGNCDSYDVPSKCFYAAGPWVAEAPLVADFTHTAPVCHCNTIQFIDTTTGGKKPYTYSWAFGDGGTSTVQNPSHHYANPGTYEVTLTVWDSSSPQQVDSQTYPVTVRANPVANFSASPTSGCAPLTVTFTDASTPGSPNGGAITKWEWDFTNDGSFDRIDKSPPGSFTYTYSSPGTYSVTLRVTDENGCTKNLTKIGYITVNDCCVSPSITQQPASVTVCAGSSVTFSVTATGTTPLSYQWQRLVGGTWQDISGATDASYTINPVGTGDAGSYRVIVTNPCGSVTSSVATLTVPGADVRITKTDSPDPVVAGSQLTYTLVITNEGPCPAQNVVVTEAYPAGFTYGSASPAPTSGNNVWNLGTLAPSEEKTITITGTVSPSASGTLTNSVSVTSGTPDPTLGNNSDTEETAVNASADVSVTKADSPDPVVAGTTLTYTLTVAN